MYDMGGYDSLTMGHEQDIDTGGDMHSSVLEIPLGRTDGILWI